MDVYPYWGSAWPARVSTILFLNRCELQVPVLWPGPHLLKSAWLGGYGGLSAVEYAYCEHFEYPYLRHPLDGD